MAKKLNQVVAIRKGVQKRRVEDGTEVYRQLSVPGLYNGLTKKYHPREEGGESLPDESQKVQFNAEERLKKLAGIDTELFDIELTTDAANSTATADVVVDGKPLVTAVPATTLLFLEKKLQEMKDSVRKTVTLSTDEDWQLDPSSGLYRTEPRRTHRTKKVEQPIVLYPATEKHPAQTQMTTKDVIDGEWETVKLSGALPSIRKNAIVERLDKLLDAVKSAREKANDIEVTDKKMGESLFNYLLG